jgi:hypothetical protein
MCFVKMYVFELFFVAYVLYVNSFKFVFCMQDLLFILHIVIVAYITCTFILYEKRKKKKYLVIVNA